jgi:hypothetical protein
VAALKMQAASVSRFCILVVEQAILFAKNSVEVFFILSVASLNVGYTQELP